MVVPRAAAEIADALVRF